MGPLLVLVSPCFMENVTLGTSLGKMLHAKLHLFLCSLDKGCFTIRVHFCRGPQCDQ